MGRILIPSIYILIVVSLLISSSGTVHAMSAYSRLYRMRCDECHKKDIPELNEFGISFYKNGFMLPGREVKEKQNEPQETKGESAAVTAAETSSGNSSKDASEKAVAEKEKTESDEDEKEAAPPPPPPPPTVVYKLQSHDGSVYFTDNPYRKDHMPQKQAQGVEAPTSLSVKGDIAPRKPVKSEQPKSLHLSPGKERVPLSEKPERYRNYEECMERQLAEAPQPGSAQEMMDLFVAAEKKCAAYQTGKR